MPRVSELHEVSGYRRCRDCGRLVPEGFAAQTYSRCEECFTARNPLVALEVIRRGSRTPIPVRRRKERAKPNPGPSKPESEAVKLRGFARRAAQKRIIQLFPDLFALFYDEERVKRGLHPVARYNPLDYQQIVSKTLDFHEVYDALQSSGVTDGP